MTKYRPRRVPDPTTARAAVLRQEHDEIADALCETWRFMGALDGVLDRTTRPRKDQPTPEGPAVTDRDPVLCANGDHYRDTPAAARVTWPNGPYQPTTACMKDLRLLIAQSREEGHALNIELFGTTS